MRTMIAVMMWLLLFTGLGTARSEAGPQTLFVLDTIADAYIDDFETSGVLDGVPDRISDTNALLPGKGMLSGGKAIDSRSITVFDLRPYQGLALGSVTLTGYGRRVDKFDPAGITVNVYVYEGDGLISLGDFNASAVYAGQTTLPELRTGQNDFAWDKFQPFEIDVTESVRSLYQDGLEFLEFRWTSDDLSGYIEAGDAEWGEYAPVNHGPRLNVVVTPEPLSGALFLLGAGVLWAGRIKRRARF